MRSASAPPAEHLDVLVVGAGLSGISAAWHLQTAFPSLRYAIIESRERMGGTWDLFRYPGIRSDSDMYTLGYRFQPWQDAKAIADGPSIRRYIEETARIHGIDRRIRYQHRLRRASWSSAAQRWTIDIEVGESRAPRQLTCNFLYSCTGYYDYDRAYIPEWPQMERFTGRVIHPQFWPEELDYAGKRVVVIGSGATAVTLVPAMSTGERAAAHVTMLQRSPSYVASLPAEDRLANRLRALLPVRAAYAITRWKNVARSMFYYHVARSRPDAFKRVLRAEAVRVLGAAFPVDEHFAPRYQPWDERLCMVPDGDLFRALRERRASIVTGTIAHFDETGIVLDSGQRLDADIVIAATGLRMSLLTGVELLVDGVPVHFGEHFVYKGMMLNGVPNFAAAVGYTNASWTLKCDLIAQHVCRLMRYMQRHDYGQVTPVAPADIAPRPVFDFTSGYVRRALPSLPRQGDRTPWKLYQNYLLDLLTLRHGRVDARDLQFAKAGSIPSSIAG